MSEDGNSEIPAEDPVIKRYRELAKRTQNPVYAWLAIGHLLQDQNGLQQGWPKDRDVVLPGWIAAHLQWAADRLLHLASGIDPRIDTPPLDFSKYSSAEEAFSSEEFRETVEARRIAPPEAMKAVPAALGLTRGGRWNAFSSFLATINKGQEFLAYEEMKAKGIPGKIAVDVVGKGIGIEDHSRIYERIKEGRGLAAEDRVGDLPPVDPP